MSREINSPQEFIELQRECIARVKYYVDKANNLLGICLAYPRVWFSIQGTTAGTANYIKNEIKFSPVLLRENADVFLDQTVGHEVGHLAAGKKFGIYIDPHGTEWASVMQRLGLPATRCHNYDTSNVPTKVGRVKNKTNKIVQVNGIRLKTIGIGKIISFD